MTRTLCSGTPARRPRAKTGLGLAVLALFSLLSAACATSGNPAIKEITVGGPVAKESGAQQSTIRITLIMKTLTNPFFVEMEKGARTAQRETHIDLQVKTATQETSIEQQIQLVEDEIKAKAKAIVIAPGDSSRLVPVLGKAQSAGICIVNIDNHLNPEAIRAAGMKPVPFISVDNEKGAFLATKFVVDGIRSPTEAALIEGIRTADNARLRKLGAERGFHSNPNLKIVAEETANWKIDEAFRVARKLFKSHPRIGVLFCANDMMAIGVIKYLQETGRTGVKVIGFDDLEEARAAIRAGLMAVTVNQQADRQGYLGVMTALKLLQGDRPPAEIEVDTRLVTQGTLK